MTQREGDARRDARDGRRQAADRGGTTHGGNGARRPRVSLCDVADPATWRLVLVFLPARDLLCVGRANRRLRAIVRHPSFLCDVMDRVCGVPSAQLQPFFSALRAVAPWAAAVASAQDRRPPASSSAAAAAEDDYDDDGRRRRPARASGSPIVTAAVAACAMVNVYRRIAAPSAASATSGIGSNSSNNGHTDAMLAQLQAASSTAGAAQKAALVRRALDRGADDEHAHLILPLAFALAVHAAGIIARDPERYAGEEAAFIEEDSPTAPATANTRSNSPYGGGDGTGPPCVPASTTTRRQRAREAVSNLIALSTLLPVSYEFAELASSLEHAVHLLVVLDQSARHDELAASTCVENGDDVHDLNENLQALLSSDWLERTYRQLKVRGKPGRKWMSPALSALAQRNPRAATRHQRWCRHAHRSVQLHRTGLPAITSFSVVADHPSANGFFQSLALATQHRLAESQPELLRDAPPFVANPRLARLDAITVLDLLRLGEMDSVFFEQLATFEPRTGYDR